MQKIFIYTSNLLGECELKGTFEFFQKELAELQAVNPGEFEGYLELGNDQIFYIYQDGRGIFCKEVIAELEV